jgi:hypothetical protein
MILNTNQIITYLLEASAIALVNRYILGRSSLDRGVLTLMIMIAASHIVMDLFAPAIATASRQGTGFGLGAKMIGGGPQAAAAMKRILQRKGQLGGMDDPVAMDYYKNQGRLSDDTARGGPIYGSMIATSLDGESNVPVIDAGPPVSDIDVIERSMDDKVALDSNKNDLLTEDVHEKLVNDVVNQPVDSIEPFDIGPTAGERGLVYGYVM